MTVGAIIDRLFRTYLYPPDYRPAQCLLAAGISSADTSIQLGTFAVPEDELLLSVGVQLELGSEIAQVTAYDENSTTATVVRAQMGTTATSHSAGSFVTLAPAYTRQSALEAVADNILTLYPSLYTVNTKNLSPAGPGVYDIEDGLAVSVLTVWPDVMANAVNLSAEMVDFHPAVGGRALLTNVSAGSIWVRYRRRFGDASAETDTYADLGMEERWANIVIAGAAADLFAGRDVPASHVDWVGAALEAENIPVGSRSSIARNLAAYRSYLLDNAKKEMKAEYRATSRHRDPTSVVHRSAWG